MSYYVIGANALGKMSFYENERIRQPWRGETVCFARTPFNYAPRRMQNRFDFFFRIDELTVEDFSCAAA